MEVTVEVTEGLERRMKVHVPAEQIDSEVESRLKAMCGRARIAGFRPGKAPLSVVKAKFGGQVRQEVLGEVLQSSFYEAVSQESLHPAGGPRIEPQELESGKALQYTATFEVYPEIELADPAAIAITRPVVEIIEADVDEVVERLRRQHTEWKAVERAAQEGDQVKINFTGTIAGEEFPGGSGKEVALVLGSAAFIPGFEEQLLGVKKGEHKTVEVTFPDNYQKQDLAGKTAHFAVEVVTISEPELPPVDEEFARRFRVQDGNVETLRAEIRGNMQRELDQAIKSRIKQQVLDGLLQINPIEAPKTLIDEEIDRLMAQTKEQVLMGRQAPKEFELPRSMFEEQAGRRVRLGLLFAEIARKQEITADPDRVRALIETQAAGYEHPEEVVKWYYSKPEHLSSMESVVLEEQLVDWVVGKAKVSDETMSFESIMNPVTEKAE